VYQIEPLGFLAPARSVEPPMDEASELFSRTFGRPSAVRTHGTDGIAIYVDGPDDRKALKKYGIDVTGQGRGAAAMI
jgi:hypothetical protein